jgi:hypothetical protein
MTNAGDPPFNPEPLTPTERHELLVYYRGVAREMTLKIEQLRDGSHTLFSENGIQTLEAIRNIYRDRINALVNLTEQSKARK